MVMAIDEVLDRLVEAFLDFSFEPFCGTGINRVRHQNAFIRYIKYQVMKVILKSVQISRNLADGPLWGFLCRCRAHIERQHHCQHHTGKFDQVFHPIAP
jgi:hypothetical protein